MEENLVGRVRFSGFPVFPMTVIIGVGGSDLGKPGKPVKPVKPGKLGKPQISLSRAGEVVVSWGWGENLGESPGENPQVLNAIPLQNRGFPLRENLR